MIKKILCFLQLHITDIIHHEEGKGKEFRVVHACHCGTTVHKGDWTDDNQLLGYGSK